jgi:hypothetical protein
MKTWHLVYNYHHFPIKINYYLPYVFDTLKICWYNKNFSIHLHIEKPQFSQNKWAKGCHISNFMHKLTQLLI